MTGLMGLVKWEITAISSNFISLMLILSISMNIHIINNYKINYQNVKIKDNLINTLKKIFWPCFYTAITTMVAFGSLIFSNIKPLIDFGYIMILALIIIFITSFSILPLLIYYFPKIKNIQLKFNILSQFFKLSIQKGIMILSFNLLIFIISIYGITKLNVENSFINYFKSSTQIFKGMKLIDTELGGTTPLDVIITFDINKTDVSNDNIVNSTNDEDDIMLDEDFELIDDLFDEVKDENQNFNWFTDEKINTIKKIHEYLESRSEIGKVQSLYSLIKMANLVNKNPLNIFELSVLYKEIPNNYKENLIKPFLSIDKNMIKISSRIKDSNDIDRNKLITDVNYYLDNNFDNIKEYKVNGLLKSNRRIKSSASLKFKFRYKMQNFRK
jgi:predicted RND superfamily exporter protein